MQPQRPLQPERKTDDACPTPRAAAPDDPRRCRDGRSRRRRARRHGFGRRGGEPPTGGQATTIGVKPDGAGGYALIIGNRSVPAGAPLPGNLTLPADFDPHGGCDLKPSAKPHAMAIKGSGATTTYTVMCASAAPMPLAATLDEGLTSLQTMRASVASQPASAQFPESERRHALGAIDRSIAAVKAARTNQP